MILVLKLPEAKVVTVETTNQQTINPIEPPIIEDAPTIPVPTIEEIIKRYDWDTTIALAIARAEGGIIDKKDKLSFNTRATNYNANGSIDRGVFQINSVHLKMVNGDSEKLYDPEINIEIAYKLYKKSGWTPWVAYKSGTYIKYLSDYK